MRKALSLVSSAALLTLFIGPVSGRLIENWPYERLFKEADLVVIATAEATAETKDRFKTNGWKIDFIGQETSFAVETILKGKVKGEKKIKMLHFRLPDGVDVNNGPLHVSFPPKGLLLSGKVKGRAFEMKLTRPEYMLFLRLRADGRYEPVSGQIDPALSVREMFSGTTVFSKLGRK